MYCEERTTNLTYKLITMKTTMKNLLNLIGTIALIFSMTQFMACNEDILDPDPPVEELGTVLWTYGEFNVNPEPTANVMITAPAIGPDGTIYVASGGGTGTWVPAKLHAINPDSTFKWATADLDHVGSTNPVVGEDGTIYIIGYYTVYAINPADGSFKWTYEVSAELNEHYQIWWLTLGNDGQVFFAHIGAGSYARHIYALNSDGQLMWKLPVSWGARNLIVGTNGTLYAYWSELGDVPTIAALDPNTGAINWTSIIEGTLQGPNGIAISTDGNLIFSQSGPDKLVKMNAATGEIIWQVDALRGYPSVGPNGSSYILASDLYCYNPDGSLKWQSGTYWGAGAKIAIDSDGNAYVSASDHGSGNFQVFRPDGTTKWAKYQSMSASLCVAIGNNNVIYVSAATNYPGSSILYALQGDRPLAVSGWPRDTGGNKNSRNVNVH